VKGLSLGTAIALCLGMSQKPYDIRARTYLFARESIAFGRRIAALRDFVLNRLVIQLVDAAGSVGANLEEAADGQTKPDFTTKNCISLKEVRESKFWLRQIRDAEPERLGPEATPLIEEAEELRRILTSIVVKSKKNPKSAFAFCLVSLRSESDHRIHARSAPRGQVARRRRDHQ
jgi:four helix bundle protein